MNTKKDNKEYNVVKTFYVQGAKIEILDSYKYFDQAQVQKDLQAVVDRLMSEGKLC